jgi:hypothetical protein
MKTSAMAIAMAAPSAASAIAVNPFFRRYNHPFFVYHWVRCSLRVPLHLAIQLFIQTSDCHGAGGRWRRRAGGFVRWAKTNAPYCLEVFLS